MDDQTLAGAYDTAIHGVMRAGYSQDAGLAAALAAHARQDPSRQDNYAALLAYSAELFTSRTQFKLHNRKRFDEAFLVPAGTYPTLYKEIALERGGR